MSDKESTTLDEKDTFKNRMGIAQKESELKESSVNARYEQFQEGKERLDKAEGFSLKDRRKNHQRSIEKGKESSKYIEDSRNSLIFIDKIFNKIVPFFANNLIFLSAKTGNGKTTILANCAYAILAQAGGAVLVLTNEEKEVDCYNRITALIKGWHYINHNAIPEEHTQFYEKMIPILSQKLTVIDNHDEEIPESTTTLEGVVSLLEKALLDVKEDGSPFYTGGIIIDYYQGITTSDKFPHLNEYEVQRRFTDFLGDYITRAPFPVVLLSQLSDQGKGKNELDFKRRIEGTKKILNKATCAMEITADRENQRTAWTIHKGRYVEMVGQTVFTGYDKGKFVPYTEDFAASIEQRKLDKALKQDRIDESKKLKEQIDGNESGD